MRVVSPGDTAPIWGGCVTAGRALLRVLHEAVETGANALGR